MKKIKYLLVGLMLFMCIGGISAGAFTTEDTFNCRNSEVSINENHEVCIYRDRNTNDSYFCLDNGKPIHGNIVYTEQVGQTITATGSACAIKNAIDNGRISVPTADGTYYFTTFNSEEDNFLVQEDVWSLADNANTCVITETTPLSAGSITTSSTPINMVRETIGNEQFYTGTISVTHSNLINGKYTISKSNDDLKVSTSKGGVSVTSTDSETLYVRIPVSKVSSDTDYTVTFSSQYKSSIKTTITPFINIYYYTSDNSGRPNSTNWNASNQQRLGKLGLTKTTEQIDAPVNASVTLKVTVDPTLTLKKVDASGNLVVGSKMKVVDPDGNSTEYTLTTATKKITNLKFGKYCVTEVTAPDGYTISNEEFCEVLSPTNMDATITVINYKTKTIISKKDVTTGEELPGATLQILDENKNPILDENGEELYTWVSTNEPHIIEGLPVGIYYLKEVIQPEGYKLQEEVKQFEVKSDGSVTRAEMENDIYTVPPTLGARSALFSAIAMFDIALGIGIVTYVRKNKFEK